MNYSSDKFLSTLDLYQHTARISERWVQGRLFAQVCAWHDAWDRSAPSCVRDAETLALALDPNAKISHGICAACAVRMKVDPLPIR